jgi:hypothetical protein
LEFKQADLRSKGFGVRFNRADGTPKPGSSLGASCGTVVGLFAIWITGEADYDITDGRGDALAHKWGMTLNDNTFVGAYEEFTDLLSKLR